MKTILSACFVLSVISIVSCDKKSSEKTSTNPVEVFQGTWLGKCAEMYQEYFIFQPDNTSFFGAYYKGQDQDCHACLDRNENLKVNGNSISDLMTRSVISKETKITPTESEDIFHFDYRYDSHNDPLKYTGFKLQSTSTFQRTEACNNRDSTCLTGHSEEHRALDFQTDSATYHKVEIAKLDYCD